MNTDNIINENGFSFEEKDVENHLVFVVDQRKFSISFKDVKLIVTGRKPTPVPDFPDYVSGTIVEQNDTITVINLRKRFGYKPKEFSERDCIIISATEEKIGLLCDKADGFLTIPKDKILPPPNIKDETAARFIKGQFVDSDGQIIYIITPKLIVRPDDEEKIFGQNKK